MFRIKTLLGSAVLACALSTTHALAQRDQVEEVIVYGKYLSSNILNSIKTPTPILDVPQSLSIVTAEQIARRGFTGVSEIINYTAGVSTSQGEGHRDAVVFRGVRSTADFFVDGMRDDVQYYRPLYNLEQVEILRGPNALLFGRGGTGGVLNRVTKKALLGEDFATYQAGADSFGEFGIQIDSNTAVSETSAVRINALYEGLSNHRDFYDGDRVGINPTITYELNPDTTLELFYEYVDHERFVDRGIPTGSDGRPVEAFEKILFADPDLNTTRLEAHVLRAVLQHRFAEGLKGHFSALYGEYDKLYQNLYASGYDQAKTPGVVTLDGYVDATRRDNLIVSANLIGEFSSGRIGHTLIAGAEFIDTSSNQDRFNSFWNTTSDDNEIFAVARPLSLSGGIGVNASGMMTTNSFAADINDDTRVNIDVLSLYVQDEIELSEHLDVILGARFDSFDIDVLNVLADETRHRKDEEVSPRAGLVYKPRENISLYASYSESFLPRSGEQYANINGDNNRLDPNTFTNLEIGVKWDFAQGLSLTAAVFEIEQSSPQVADNDPSTLDVIDSQVDGFEVQLQGHLTDRWHLSAGYSSLDGEQVTRSGPTGLRPRELPENMFSLWTTCQVTAQFGLGAGLIYQDESFINNSNSAVLPSYTRIDVAAYYDVSDRLRLQLNVENLNDELYFPNAHSTHQATVGAPLNARITISGRF